MRKKTIYVLATVMCMSIFTACGSTNRADSGNEVQQEVQAEDNMQKEQQAGAEGNAETEIQTETIVPENASTSESSPVYVTFTLSPTETFSNPCGFASKLNS